MPFLILLGSLIALGFVGKWVVSGTKEVRHPSPYLAARNAELMETYVQRPEYKK